MKENSNEALDPILPKDALTRIFAMRPTLLFQKNQKTKQRRRGKT